MLIGTHRGDGTRNRRLEPTNEASLRSMPIFRGFFAQCAFSSLLATLGCTAPQRSEHLTTAARRATLDLHHTRLRACEAA
jgi:hypothetical protein